MTYQWSKNGASISGATLSSYKIAQVRPADAGVYTVKVTNAGGSVTSSGATLTVLVPPVITAQPQDRAVGIGQSGFFSVTAMGTAPLNYQWSFNGTVIPGATGSAYTVTNAQPTNVGFYSAVVSNNVGTACSSNAILAVTGPSAASSGDIVCVAGTNVSTLTWWHTVGPGNNRILIVGIALAETSDSVSSVTYARIPLARITSIQNGNTVEMWYLLAPPIGTAILEATWTGNKDMAGWSGTFTNVDQTNPIRSSAVASGNTSTPGVTVASAAADLVVDTLSANGDAVSLMVGEGQTQLCQNTTGAGGADCWGAASYEQGAASVTMSWLTGAAKSWGIAAAALKAAPTLQADLATTQTGPASVMAGANLTYTVNVTNAGPVEASHIIVADTLPPDATFFSASGGGEFSGGVVTWPAFNLAANACTNLTVTVTAPGSGTLTALASSTASTYDPDALNNNGTAASAQVVTTVTPQGSPAPAGPADMACITATGASTRMWSHTVSAGEDRLLIVGIALADNSETVSSVTYGSTPLTRLISSQKKNTVELWYLLAPPVGTADLLATWTGNKDMAGWSGTFTNVAQTNPFRNSAVAFGTSRDLSVTVISTVGDLVVDTLSANGDAKSLAPGTDQRLICRETTGTGGGDCWGAASFKPGAPDSTTMSWQAGDSKDWDMAAVALKAAPPLQADLIAALAGPTTVPVGSDFSYTVSVANLGPQSATNIVIRGTLPSGVELLGSSGGGAIKNGVVSWTIPNLPSTATADFTLALRALTAGSFTTTVIASAGTGDPDPANNASWMITTATNTGAPVLCAGQLTGPGGNMRLSVSGSPGQSLTVVCSKNVALPLSDWTVLGQMTETAPGQYEFTDPQPSTNLQCYYRIRGR